MLPQAQQSLELLKQRLLEEEERLKEQEIDEEETKAFAAWSNNRAKANSFNSNGRNVPYGGANISQNSGSPSGNSSH
jgi:hypothetical protein